MSRERLVIVGNGMAGVRLLEELLAHAPERYEISVFGAEPHGCYNRILLSPVLAGEKSLAEIITHAPSWYEARGVRLQLGDPVVEIDRERRRVRAASGLVADYDRLVLATGSTPFVPPIPGRELGGVTSFRDIGDVQAMMAAAQRGGRATVIGGGLLGLEAACALRGRGMAVSVVHLGGWLMERQLDRHAATLLQASLEARGIRFKLGAQTTHIHGENGVVSHLSFADGSRLDSELVVISIGIKANAALARSAGLACERGILVDDRLQTDDPAIFAVGECAQHRGVCYGLVAPLYEQGRTLARVLAGEDACYTGSLLSTKLKVTGIEVFSAGSLGEGEGRESLVFRDPRQGVYKRLVVEDGRLVGGVLYGNTADSNWYLDLIQNRAELGALREGLVFGRALAEAA